MPMDDLLPLTPDPVIEFYKKNVAREAIRANLQLSVEERFNKLMRGSVCKQSKSAKRPSSSALGI
ncbi:MAG: hypothetical protein JO316_16455 [Abitibacteriaceae bacterium]|nr:hypothetical protein [Abditibacteriaceae bacterium]